MGFGADFVRARYTNTKRHDDKRQRQRRTSARQRRQRQLATSTTSTPHVCGLTGKSLLAVMFGVCSVCVCIWLWMGRVCISFAEAWLSQYMSECVCARGCWRISRVVIISSSLSSSGRRQRGKQQLVFHIADFNV